MKIYILTCFLALGVLFNVSAQEIEIVEPVREVNLNGPVMTLESTTVDYGEIERGSDKVRYLEFTNTGKEPLIISNARGSCGCTVPEWPKHPIAPGATEKLKVSYDTNRLGKFSKTITLTTNEGTKPQVIKVIGLVNKKEEALPVKNADGGFGG